MAIEHRYTIVPVASVGTNEMLDVSYDIPLVYCFLSHLRCFGSFCSNCEGCDPCPAPRIDGIVTHSANSGRAGYSGVDGEISVHQC